MQRTFRLLLSLALLLFVLPAFGQYKRDKAANAKIDEALNEHYLATDFQKAEDVLVGTIKACEEQCSPKVLARAWMYVGIVRGSGKQDQVGAKEAFTNARGLDPSIALDDAMATPETRATFAAVAGGAAPPAVDQEIEEVPTEGAEAEAPVPAAGLSCSPDGISLQTRRALPVSCQSGEEAALTLRYQEFGSEEWKSITMSKVGPAYQATVPCEASNNAGPLRYYVIAADAAGDPIDTYGTKSSPIVIDVAANVSGAAPSFPGQSAPERCAEKEICPPDFPGCSAGDKGAARGSKDWGASCENSSECKSGLLCTDGTCQTAPSCDVDSDCQDGGVCVDGSCDIDMDAGQKASYPRHHVGLHFAADIAFISGKNICQTSNSDFECYYADNDEPYPPKVEEIDGKVGDAYPGANINGGAALGTVRALLSYDFAATPNVTLGLRAGFAFLGGTPEDFVPFHGEARVAYWFTGLGSTFRPYLHLGGGFAEVDVGTKMEVKDCSQIDNITVSQVEACANATGAYDSSGSAHEDLPRVEVVAYKKLGFGFVGAGGGVVYGVTDAVGLQLNLNAMYMLGSVGFVLEPSLGATVSF